MTGQGGQLPALGTSLGRTRRRCPARDWPKGTLCANVSDCDMSAADLSDAEYARLAETRRLLRHYIAFSERAAEDHGLEPRQYQVLLMLRALGPEGSASITDVADWLQVRHHSAVGLIDRMQARGLLQRSAHPEDKRFVQVRLTSTGSAALSGLALEHRDELRRSAPALIDVLRQHLAVEQPA
jgi:DNA-binding MarR family transcriptional regulator